MAKEFEVSVTKYPLKEGSTDMSTTATNITTTLNALEIGNDHEVYEIGTFKHQGFLWVVCINEA